MSRRGKFAKMFLARNCQSSIVKFHWEIAWIVIRVV